MSSSHEDRAPRLDNPSSPGVLPDTQEGRDEGRVSSAAQGRPAKTPQMVALLTEFALWASPVWEADNSDDREAARQWVLHYLEGGDGP